MRSITGLVLAALVPAFCGAGCDRFTEPSQPSAASVSSQEDLLIGYEILSDTLSDESQLGLLNLFKTLTFSGPVAEVDEILKTVRDASKKHSKELEKLRKLAPDVSAAPAANSPIGDAITAVAKEIGTDEMIHKRGGEFNVRFILLQAQATRMVAAIATAIAKFDPNAERQAWLESVATEYEAYRDEMIEIIRKYVRGRGAAQQ